MSNFDNTNRGAIWRNQKKEKDSQPDFKGDINIDGVDYWVSAWKRNAGAKPNSPALSFSVQRKDQTHAQGHTQVTQTVSGPVKTHTSPPAAIDSFDDDIPF